MKNLYVIIQIEAFSDRPEVLFASSSKSKIDTKLEEIKNSYDEKFIFNYEKKDCLILKDDTAFYIEKVREFL